MKLWGSSPNQYDSRFSDLSSPSRYRTLEDMLFFGGWVGLMGSSTAAFALTTATLLGSNPEVNWAAAGGSIIFPPAAIAGSKKASHIAEAREKKQ